MRGSGDQLPPGRMTNKRATGSPFAQLGPVELDVKKSPATARTAPGFGRTYGRGFDMLSSLTIGQTQKKSLNGE